MALKSRFFKIISVIAAVMMFALPGVGATNVPTGDIGDYGAWTTTNNLRQITKNMSDDLAAFDTRATTQPMPDYVPIEARVGLAFMGALSYLADVIDNSLVRFMTIFIITMFIFWIMAEAYNMMTTSGNAKKLVEDIIKKAALIAVWIIILEMGPARIFMWLMGPIITVGTYLADLILESVTMTVGAQMPDTCAAIREYVAANASPNMIIDAAGAADIMCLPTRLSGFFHTGVAAGFKWMTAGIGHSAFTFVTGAAFVVIFAINIWKFALMAMGVIADLFLAVMMLPFTAVAETIGKTSYKGIAGTVFNGFVGIFNTQSLSKQIGRFINASVYFVSLSIVIAVCAAMLSGVVSGDLAAQVPGLNNTGFIPTLLVALLVGYFANMANKIAGDLGGSINDKIGTGQLGADIKKMWAKGTDGAKKLAKILKETK